MEQTIFCTIITPDYLNYALALRESMLKLKGEFDFYIFVSDFQSAEFKKIVEEKFTRTTLVFCDDLITIQRGKNIFDKYYTVDKDKFRWSMKPVLIEYLLTEKNSERVFYVDCDVRFYNSFAVLESQLADSSVLLSPHFRSSDPIADEFNFIQLYIYGLFNGGFIGVTKKGLAAMRWWADANYFICEVDKCKGQFVDQSHLNLIPVYFDDVSIIRHRGCNVAGWNLLECKRTFQNDKVMINGTYDIIFIHFSISTAHFIKTGSDPLLAPHLEEYEESLFRFGPIRDMALEKSGYPKSGPPLKKEPGVVRKVSAKIKSILKGTSSN